LAQSGVTSGEGVGKMSKIFDAMSMVESRLVDQPADLPSKLQKLRTPEYDDCWKAEYYPKFTAYKIERFLEYLLSLHEQQQGRSYGIIPVADVNSISRIVLETMMHLSANCSGKTVMADLSTSSEMLELLDETNSFDQLFPLNQPYMLHTVLHDLFHFMSFSENLNVEKRSGTFNALHLLKMIESYQFKLFLFPTIANFNVDCVQLIRHLDDIILMSPDNSGLDLENNGKFLHRLGVKAKGVYLVE